MELLDPIPGAPERRPVRVTACTEWTGELRAAERDVTIHALVAVQLDARVWLTCEAVRRNVLLQLRIPEHELSVVRLKPATFLLRFLSPHLRNEALAARVLSMGRVGLRLMPWTKQVNATSSSLCYRGRVCLEGVPSHGHQIETVRQLFRGPVFVDGVDDERERDEEIGCFCLWLWTSDPDAIAKTGVLQIAEPVEVTEEYFIRLGNKKWPDPRDGPAKLLDYDVLIHVDRVLDYSR
ncbi:hypothetical protein C2845_PM07G06010 [Panicum miliaceum]|uniref:DUF4283 domain-containing protein n=1 Tax=Panicum miliaceum TaxID=4540 RepID=A0A3L6SU61_PANMI|nr:hypothetical protein C2845_PM07G06010 [Panicum miliaceum]